MNRVNPESNLTLPVLAREPRFTSGLYIHVEEIACPRILVGANEIRRGSRTFSYFATEVERRRASERERGEREYRRPWYLKLSRKNLPRCDFECFLHFLFHLSEISIAKPWKLLESGGEFGIVARNIHVFVFFRIFTLTGCTERNIGKSVETWRDFLRGEKYLKVIRIANSFM